MRVTIDLTKEQEITLLANVQEENITKELSQRTPSAYVLLLKNSIVEQYDKISHKTAKEMTQADIVVHTLYRMLK